MLPPLRRFLSPPMPLYCRLLFDIFAIISRCRHADDYATCLCRRHVAACFCFDRLALYCAIRLCFIDRSAIAIALSECFSCMLDFIAVTLSYAPPRHAAYDADAMLLFYDV